MSIYKLSGDQATPNFYTELLRNLHHEGKNQKSWEQCRQEGEFTVSTFIPRLQRTVISPEKFPFNLTNHVSLRMAWDEMVFFLQGKTQTNELVEKGIRFWEGNTTAEFLKNRGLGHLDPGDMGKAYGYQWRKVEGNDQLYNLVEGLIEQLVSGRANRRLMVNLWNPSELDVMALPPCWYSLQAYIHHPKDGGLPYLNFILNNRSLDVAYGFWYAVSQYRMFQLALASLLDMRVGVLDLRMADQHIYQSQMDWVAEILNRESAVITNECNNSIGISENIALDAQLNSFSAATTTMEVIDRLVEIKFSDFETDYRFYNSTPMKTPRPAMAA